MYVLENNEHHFTKLFVAKLDMKRVFNIFSIKKQIYSYLYNRFWYKLFHESLLDYIFYSVLTHLPTWHRHPIMQLSNQEWEEILAPSSTVHLQKNTNCLYYLFPFIKVF